MAEAPSNIAEHSPERRDAQATLPGPQISEDLGVVMAVEPGFHGVLDGFSMVFHVFFFFPMFFMLFHDLRGRRV